MILVYQIVSRLRRLNGIPREMITFRLANNLSFLLSFIPFHSISFHSIQFHSIPFHTISLHSNGFPFHCLRFHSITFHSIWFHSIVISLHAVPGFWAPGIPGSDVSKIPTCWLPDLEPPIGLGGMREAETIMNMFTQGGSCVYGFWCPY